MDELSGILGDNDPAAADDDPAVIAGMDHLRNLRAVEAELEADQIDIQGLMPKMKPNGRG